MRSLFAILALALALAGCGGANYHIGPSGSPPSQGGGRG